MCFIVLHVCVRCCVGLRVLAVWLFSELVDMPVCVRVFECWCGVRDCGV